MKKLISIEELETLDIAGGKKRRPRNSTRNKRGGTYKTAIGARRRYSRGGPVFSH